MFVTGSSGFIGSQLCQHLKSGGSNVVKFTRNDLTDKEGNVIGIDKFLFEEHLDNTKTVVHLANCAHKKFKESDYLCVDLEGTKRLLQACKEKGVNRFIYLSSVNVYGSGEKNRLTINTPLNPQQPQALSKSRVESYIKTFCENSSIDYVIIRAPMVYGEGVKANFAALMNLVNKKVPLPFRAITKNKRSLVSVYNLVDLITVCINHSKAANKVFLVSDDDDLSTAEIVSLMAKVQGKRNLALPIPTWCFKLAGKIIGKQDLVDRLIGSLDVDISHTKKTLDWTPPYSVEYGFSKSTKK